MGKSKKRHNKTNQSNSNQSITKPTTAETSTSTNLETPEAVSSDQTSTETNSKQTTVQKRDMDSCLFAFRLARDHNQPKYHARTQRYIMENFDDAVREPKFYDELTKDDIIVFLQADDLVVSCEEVVYHMVIRWVKHKLSERLKHLEELLELVRFPQLELDFLGQQVVRESIVLDTSIGQLLLHEAFEHHQSKIAKEHGYKHI